MPILRQVLELSTDDIQVGTEILVLKGVSFYRPYLTAAAINEDTVLDNGTLGGIMVAQTAPYASNSSGLQAINEQVFVIKDEARSKWKDIKDWLKDAPVNVLETRLPNDKFTSLFPR